MDFKMMIKSHGMKSINKQRGPERLNYKINLSNPKELNKKKKKKQKLKMKESHNNRIKPEEAILQKWMIEAFHNFKKTIESLNNNNNINLIIVIQ